MNIETRLYSALQDTLETVAQEYCDDLGQFLYEHHRITGLLAASIGYERVGPDEVVAGSDVPYAGFFEAKTGAVEKFTDEWQPKAGTVAVTAGKTAAAKRLP